MDDSDRAAALMLRGRKSPSDRSFQLAQQNSRYANLLEQQQQQPAEVSRRPDWSSVLLVAPSSRLLRPVATTVEPLYLWPRERADEAKEQKAAAAAAAAATLEATELRLPLLLAVYSSLVAARQQTGATKSPPNDATEPGDWMLRSNWLLVLFALACCATLFMFIVHFWAKRKLIDGSMRRIYSRLYGSRASSMDSEAGGGHSEPPSGCVKSCSGSVTGKGRGQTNEAADLDAALRQARKMSQDSGTDTITSAEAKATPSIFSSIFFGAQKQTQEDGGERQMSSRETNASAESLSRTLLSLLGVSGGGGGPAANTSDGVTQVEDNKQEESQETKDDHKPSGATTFRTSRSYIKSLIDALTKASAQVSGPPTSGSGASLKANKTREFAAPDDEDEEEQEEGEGEKAPDSNDAQDEEILVSQMDISAAHLILDYMEKHLEDKERLKREWLELNKESGGASSSPSSSSSSSPCSQQQQQLKGRRQPLNQPIGSKANQFILRRLAKVALDSDNWHRNRNPAVVPFDRNRVRLSQLVADCELTGAELTDTQLAAAAAASNKKNKMLAATSKRTKFTDYINATYIYDDEPRKPTHIIAQGPTEQTVGQFWQMVWEQSISVIVMLTRLNENGNQMCHCYWPTQADTNPTADGANRRGSATSIIKSNSSTAEDANVLTVEVAVCSAGQQQQTSETNKFEVHLISEHVSSADYLVRNMYLVNKKSNQTRTICQFHYLAWPDNKVPSSVRSFLQFRRKIHKSYRNLRSPILVHCSDGAGRSGTFALVDIILERIKNGAKQIDPLATLEHLRDQRVGLCSTQSQFEFVLVALAEEIQIILNALPH